jgi:Ca-activated chloride channel family protein
MPVAGNEPAEAIQLAQKRLSQSKLPGSIVLISAGIFSTQLEGMDLEGGADVHILAMAAGADVIPPPGSPPAPALDRNAMEAAADIIGGDVVLPTADDADIRRLNSRIDTSIASAPAQEGERWKDNGYFLLPLLALLTLTFFRPGGAVALR